MNRNTNYLMENQRVDDDSFFVIIFFLFNMRFISSRCSSLLNLLL